MGLSEQKLIYYNIDFEVCIGHGLNKHEDRLGCLHVTG